MVHIYKIHLAMDGDWQKALVSSIFFLAPPRSIGFRNGVCTNARPCQTSLTYCFSAVENRRPGWAGRPSPIVAILFWY